MKEFVWLNDALIPLDQARVPVNDRGLLYGDGFFETMRAEAGTVFFLKDHLARLEASAVAFRLPFLKEIDWRQRLEELLAANGLERATARVKILLSRGSAAGLGLPAEARPTLIIWASAYEPPSPAEYEGGWPVVTFPERRSGFLGRHKSLNYLFYLTARQFALDWGAREALILEADGLVSEASAASLVYLDQGRYLTPAAPSALPGVTVAGLGRALARQSRSLEAVPTTPAKVARAEGVWLANSLLGLMPVAAIDGQEMALSDQTAFLQQILWAEGGGKLR